MRRALTAVGACLALACAPEPPPPELAARPSLVVIVVDTLRADHLSQYGYALPTSTALAPLSEAAFRFEEAFTPAVWTLPSVVSLFSGLAPARHRVDQTGGVVDPEIRTLAMSLNDTGYDTAFFSHNPHVSGKAGFDRGFDHFSDYRGKTRLYPDAEEMIVDAQGWLAKRTERPFFLYLQPMNVHGPYRVPEEARSELLGREPRLDFEFFGPLMSAIMKEGRIDMREEVSEAFVSSLREQYDTSIHYTTRQLGRLFATLQELGLWDRSVIVLTSDHGEELYDRGGFAHGYSLYREIVHVPLFIKLPGQTQSARIAESTSLVDLYPTLMDLLELPHPGAVDGVSLAPLLRGEPAPDTLRNRTLVIQATNPERCVGRSIRRGPFELLLIDSDYAGNHSQTRLYDVRSDPAQRRDLTSQHPELVEALRARLQEQVEVYESGAFPTRAFELDARERESLEALGYL